MDDVRSGSHEGRLRAIENGPISDPSVLEAAIAACMARTPGGVSTRSLPAAVAEHLGVSAASIAPRGLSVALGLMIATGGIDEVAGRLVPISQEHRQAG